VVEAMEEASRWFVDLHELNQKAGEVIARLTGAEAGLVTAGSAAGMVLEAAACMAGTDPAKIWQLPDTTGMKDQIVIHRAHRVNYDHSFRVTGAKLVEIGNTGTTHEWELEAAIGEQTAAVAYVYGPRRGGALPLSKVVEIAHAREVPVIVDAAAMLPPPENLSKYLDQGADLVSFSGGKGVLGPQSTGILAGRADLIEAAFANGSPHQFFGRGMKVAKEEIIGLVSALQIFVEEDEDAENERYRQMCQQTVDAFIEMPGLEVSLEHDPYNFLIPHAVVRLTDEWNGRSRDEIWNSLTEGDPAIYMHNIGDPDALVLDPFNLNDEELGIVIQRLHEELLKQ
jgi:L-seryl-tRNA(Ser) seleniumtransferase